MPVGQPSKAPRPDCPWRVAYRSTRRAPCSRPPAADSCIAGRSVAQALAASDQANQPIGRVRACCSTGLIAGSAPDIIEHMFESEVADHVAPGLRSLRLGAG